MSTKITIYQKPTCNTCREVYAELKRWGVDVETINYLFDPLPREKLKGLLFKLKMSPMDLMRKKEPVFAELGLDKQKFSDEHLIDCMVKHPELIQRPIIERGGKAIVARPPEKLKEIL